MSILSTQIVSALNNYNSLAPLATKDIIENFGRTSMAYCSSGKETRKYEAAEKFIDANMSSLFWFGSIPFANKVFNMTAFKAAGLNPEVSLAFLKKDEKTQTINNIVNKISSKELPQKILLKNGKLLDTKSVIEKVGENAKKFKNLQISRTILSLLFATYLSAVVLPKSIIKITQWAVNRNTKKIKLSKQNKYSQDVTFGSFEKFSRNKNISKSFQKVSFKSLGNVLFNKAVKAQSTALDGMAAMDIAISSGRIYYVDKRERDALKGRSANVKCAAALEKLIREVGAFYLIYFGGGHIKKVLDKFTNNDLDPIILEDKNFIQELKSGSLIKNPIKNLSEGKALEFIDKNINNEKQAFIKYAKKLKWIETIQNETGKIFRNPLKYVDLKNLSENFDIIAQNSSEFIKQSGENLEKFVSKQAKTKRIGIFANLAVSSFAVCYILPKIMYEFRKFYTGSNEDPGIKKVIQNAKSMIQ